MHVDNEALLSVTDKTDLFGRPQWPYSVNAAFRLDKVTSVMRTDCGVHQVSLIAGGDPRRTIVGEIEAHDWYTYDAEKNPVAMLFRRAGKELVCLPYAKAFDGEVLVNPENVVDAYPPRLYERGLVFKLASRFLKPKTCVELRGGASLVVDLSPCEARRRLGIDNAERRCPKP